MTRYIFRRIAQMIPTLFGVLLITFVLFHIVGGSPARLVLGEHASPAALEEFDEVRGFNKPLILGRWSRTRAWADGPPPTPLLEPGTHRWPLRFPLRGETTYRLLVTARAADEKGLPNIGKTQVEFFQCLEKSGEFFPMIGKNFAEFSNVWKTFRVDFRTPADPVNALAVRVSGVGLEVRSVALRRAARGIFDTQFFFFLSRVLKGDLGVSSSLNRPVIQLLREGIGPTLALTTPIFTLELVLALSLALVCARFHDRWPDHLLRVAAVALMSVNYLVWIVVGQYWLGYRWGWFPVWGFESWRYLLLPVLIGVISGLGGSLRFYRTIVLDEMTRGYVRTARAKGISERGVLFRHVLRNVLIPVITNVAITLPYLYTGSLLLESFFGIPGLGYLGVNAINSSDVDVVRAIVLIGAALYMIVHLLADLAYAIVDPRVRLT